MKMFSQLLWLSLASLVAAGSAAAADIQWRGGPGDDWHNKENWELPDDVPPETPPNQREGFRRVPNFNDRAILPHVPPSVSIRQNVLVGGLRLLDRAVLDVGPGVTLTVNSARFKVEADPNSELLIGEGARVNFQRPAQLGVVRIFGGQLHCTHEDTLFAGAVSVRAGTISVPNAPLRPAQFPEGLTILDHSDTNSPSFNVGSAFTGYGLFEGAPARLRVQAPEFELQGRLDFDGSGSLHLDGMRVLRGGLSQGSQNLLRFGDGAFIRRGDSALCLLESRVEFHGENCGLEQMDATRTTVVEFRQEVLATGPAILHAPWRLSSPARLRLVHPGCFLPGFVPSPSGQEVTEVGLVLPGASVEIRERVEIGGLKLDGGSLGRSTDAVPGPVTVELSGGGTGAGLLQIASGQAGGASPFDGSLAAIQVNVRSNATLRLGGSQVNPVLLALGNAFPDLNALAAHFRSPPDAVTVHLKSRLSEATVRFLNEYRGPGTISIQLEEALVDDFNLMIKLSAVHDPAAFADVTLRAETQELLNRNPEGAERLRLDRMLLEDALPQLLFRIPPGPVAAPSARLAVQRIENRGRVDFEFDPAHPDFAPQVSCLLGNQPGGVVSLLAGQGFDPVHSPAIINRGRIEVLKPSAGDSAGNRSRVANTLINDRGRVVAEAGVEVELSQGENLAGGRFEVGTNATVSVAFGLLADTFRYRPFNDDGTVGDEVTVNLGRLFHFRAGGVWNGAPDNGLQLLGGPGSTASGLGGVSVEEPLEVDRLFVGGPASHLPRFVAAPGPDGPALTVRKLFRWFGGRLEGNGVGNARGTRSLEVSADAQWFLGPAAQPGNAAVLASGLILNTRGLGTVDTPHRITLNTGTLWHLQPGSVTALAATDAAGIAGDFFNEGRLNKTREPLLVLGNHVRIAGELHVVAGTLRGLGTARFMGQVFLDDATAVLHAQGCVLAGTSIFGPGRLLTTASARFEETVVVDRIHCGEPGALPDSLTSGPAARLLALQELRWLGGGIRLAEDGRVELQAGAVGEFRNDHPGGAVVAWSRGSFENFGTLTYVANTRAPLGSAVGVSFINRETGRWIMHGPGQVFLAVPVGPGIPAPGTFENRGELTFDLPVEGATEVVWHPPLHQAGGRLRFARNAGAPPRAKLRIAADYLQTGGVFESAHTDINFERTLDLRGGHVLLGTGTSALAAGPATIQGAGSVLDLGLPADFIPAGGLTLLNQGILSGRGTVIGNVANPSGLVDPGLNEALVEFGALTVQGDVTFGSAALLAVDVPVNVAEPLGDRLVVTGLAALAGNVRVTPHLTPFAVSGNFIELLRAGSLTGSFTAVVAPPLAGDKRFEGVLRAGPPRFGLRVAGDSTTADLALALEAPLTAPAGAELALVFTVENRGPDSATGALLEVTLPANATFVSSDPAGTVEAGKLTVTLLSLAKDAKAAVTVKLAAPATPAALATTATVSSQRLDPAPENNAVSATTAVLVNGEFKVAKFELNGAGRLKLSFETLPGVKYRLERSTDLQTWTPVQEFLGDGTTKVADNLGGGGPVEFFRLAIL